METDDLFPDYYSPLYRYVCARLPGDVETAQDIVQEIFLDLAVNRDNKACKAFFRGESDPLTWLCAIALRRIIDHYRKMVRRQRSSIIAMSKNEDESGDKGIADPGAKTPEETFLNEETCRDVRQCLALLPADQRYALMLKYMEGYSQKDVAKVFSRSEKAVESLLGRARKAFSELYQREGE